MGHIQKRCTREALQDAEEGPRPVSARSLLSFLSLPLFNGRLGQMEQAGKLVEEMQAASKKSFVARSSLQQLLWEWARRKRRWTLWKRVTKLTIRTW